MLWEERNRNKQETEITKYLKNKTGGGGGGGGGKKQGCGRGKLLQ